jgi:hypothetical protein
MINNNSFHWLGPTTPTRPNSAAVVLAGLIGSPVNVHGPIDNPTTSTGPFLVLIVYRIPYPSNIKDLIIVIRPISTKLVCGYYLLATEECVAST